MLLNNSSSVPDDSINASVSMPIMLSCSKVLRIASRICVSVRSLNRWLIYLKVKCGRIPGLSMLFFLHGFLDCCFRFRLTRPILVGGKRFLFLCDLLFHIGLCLWFHEGCS